jgi:hypothetical protein
MKSKRFHNERGSMLLACLVIAAAILAGMVTFAQTLKLATRSNATKINSQRAYYNAESGLYAALDWVKGPNSASVDSTSERQPLTPMAGADYQVTFMRDGVDPEIIHIVSTGTHRTPTGVHVDANGRYHEAVIRATVRVQFAGDFFAAVPGRLTIAYGSEVSTGKVYGRTIEFLPGPNDPTNETKVEAAFYYDDVRDDVGTNERPEYVTFTGPIDHAQKQPSEVRVPHVGALDSYYEAMANANTPPCVLPTVAGVATLEGRWTPPVNTNSVCYVDGDLVIGNASALEVDGLASVYVTGTVHIRNNVEAPTGNWLAIMARNDIVVDRQAPNDLNLNMTAITDGAIRAEGNTRRNGNLRFNGGMIAQNGISLHQFQQSREYTFFGAPSSLNLPYLVQLKSWKVVRGGKY